MVNSQQDRTNATFLVLARNKDLEGIVKTIKSVERHFNRWFNYPYVFLNDEDFEELFKETVKRHTGSPVHFGIINDTMWGFPDWLDVQPARKAIERQGEAGIQYGGVESYHHMCRFYSGYFFKHDLLQQYDWYWRLEPDVKYMCDITYDPFLEMVKANKTYGFTIAIKELPDTIPNLFRYASAYRRKQKIKSQGLWEMFLEPQHSTEIPYTPNSDISVLEQRSPESIHIESMDGERYNMCHFWSNFEIARLSWFRSHEYNEFFTMLEKSGGFWMERVCELTFVAIRTNVIQWGDAPVHSLAAGALLAPRDIHYFRDFGYRHETIQHCPANAPGMQLKRTPWSMVTTAEMEDQGDDDYWARPDHPKENGVGCRCRCDTDTWEIETTKGSCFANWVAVSGGWAP